MNLNLLPDLALFVQIVDQGSFSAVARISGATPSAISRSVSRLEQQMGWIEALAEDELGYVLAP